MGILGKKSYLDIGRTADTGKFVAALETARKSEQKFLDLSSGALQAFCEGRIENLQILFRTMNTLKPRIAHHMLEELVKNTDNPAEMVKQAFATTPEHARRTLLTELLTYIIEDPKLNKNAPLIEALLKNGAEANVIEDGYPGTLLARAAVGDAGTQVLDLLSDYGADANGAIDRARNRSAYDNAHIKLLSTYKDRQEKKAAGENPPKRHSAASVKSPAPSASEEELKETLKQMRENINDLTQKIESLDSNIEGLIKVVGYLVKEKAADDNAPDDAPPESDEKPPQRARWTPAGPTH